MRGRRIAAAAVAGLAAIVSGAFLTSAGVGLQPGQRGPSVDLHRAIALLAILGVAVALPSRMRRAAPASLVVALLCLIAASAIGWDHPLSPAAAVAHAAVSHLFTAGITFALIGSVPRAKATAPIDAGSWRALRPAALWTPGAVYAQIVMGALYRHQITGIMPHMLGAMIVALLTIVVSAILLQHFSQSKELKRAAITLMSAVLVQICLGITVFLLLLLNLSDTGAFAWTATAHVTTGTLVFAASIWVAVEVRRGLIA